MIALERIVRKKKRLVVGLMSGTSADGIDTVLVEILNSGAARTVRQIAFQTFPYPRGFKAFLLRNSQSDTARIEDLTRLDLLLAEFFADAALKIIGLASRTPGEIDFIGSHGQTVHHLPKAKRLFGKSIRSTLQLGDSSVIAKRTGIVTVANFRPGDIAAGGSGAPLVPIFDYFMFRSRTIARGVLNIGGIANITILPKQCALSSVTAFDTGPGNMIIDGVMMEYFSRGFDKDGTVARSGKIITGLLRDLMAHPHLRLPPPKSTGREAFGKGFWFGIIKPYSRQRKEDLITTVTEFTALSIFASYLKFIGRKTPIRELLVSGGGVHNGYLMEALQRYFSNTTVRSSLHLGISPDAKEAICFALLANETMSGRPGNVPGATGATYQTILGTIALP